MILYGMAGFNICFAKILKKLLKDHHRFLKIIGQKKRAALNAPLFLN